MIDVAAKSGGRIALRDSLLIREAERHGLRAKELVKLRWDQFNFTDDTLWVVRAKNGKPGLHYLKPEEKAALRKWQRKQGGGAFVFTALGGSPMTTRSVHRVFAEVGRKAGIPFPVHCHQARHATGYRLVNEGVDTRTIQGFLGHASIRHTLRYTELAANRFKGL
jgi:type 1 fimbriae regulatory protein FimB/type 1 fimbriae regulatory protein FimE